jgi:ABC-type glycerol-3-phosphate transport system permease component
MCPFGARRPERRWNGWDEKTIPCPLPEAAAQYLGRRFSEPAATVFTVPIVVAFFFAQKTFIQGIKLTGLKE